QDGRQRVTADQMAQVVYHALEAFLLEITAALFQRLGHARGDLADHALPREAFADRAGQSAEPAADGRRRFIRLFAGVRGKFAGRVGRGGAGVLNVLFQLARRGTGPGVLDAILWVNGARRIGHGVDSPFSRSAKAGSRFRTSGPGRRG